MNLDIVYWIVVAMIFYTIGEICSKTYASTSLKQFGVWALVAYLLNAACFLPAISKFNSLSILGTIWNLSYVFVTLFLGLVVFKEPVTVTQMIGIGLGVVSIILLSI